MTFRRVPSHSTLSSERASGTLPAALPSSVALLEVSSITEEDPHPERYDRTSYRENLQRRLAREMHSLSHTFEKETVQGRSTRQSQRTNTQPSHKETVATLRERREQHAEPVSHRFSSLEHLPTPQTSYLPYCASLPVSSNDSTLIESLRALLEGEIQAYQRRVRLLQHVEQELDKREMVLNAREEQLDQALVQLTGAIREHETNVRVHKNWLNSQRMKSIRTTTPPPSQIAKMLRRHSMHRTIGDEDSKER